MHTEVVRDLETDLVLSPEHSVPVPARLTYRTEDPYAVQLSFHVTSPRPVTWTFSRDLLIEGVFRTTGEGDVRIFPGKVGGRSVVCLALSSPEGRALVTVPVKEVSGWLERTLRLVAPGLEGEWLALDEALEELLTSGA